VRRLAKRERERTRRHGPPEPPPAAPDTRGWTKLTMTTTCGCCEAVLWYKTRAAAEAAAASAANKHLPLTDDRGATETVDGFYGFELGPNNDIDPAAPPP